MESATRHTLKDGEQSVTIAPARGGLITSLILGGQEVLYMDEATFSDASRSVRGGIPILFPNAGAAGSAFPGLPSHGFARRSDAWTYTASTSSFTEILNTSSDTRAFFPHDFVLEVRGSLSRNRLVLSHIVSNPAQTALPIALGLHPYFPVRHADKTSIHFEGFPLVNEGRDVDGVACDVTGKNIESCADLWTNGGTVSVSNPKVPVHLVLPGLGTLMLEAGRGYDHFWIWSEGQRDFICVEPVMRNESGLTADPCILPPNASLELSFSIALDSEA